MLEHWFLFEPAAQRCTADLQLWQMNRSTPRYSRSPDHLVERDRFAASRPSSKETSRPDRLPLPQTAETHQAQTPPKGTPRSQCGAVLPSGAALGAISDPVVVGDDLYRNVRASLTTSNRSRQVKDGVGPSTFDHPFDLLGRQKLLHSLPCSAYALPKRTVRRELLGHMNEFAAGSLKKTRQKVSFRYSQVKHNATQPFESSYFAWRCLTSLTSET